MKFYSPLLVLSLIGTQYSCSPSEADKNSQVTVTSVTHTSVKRQSIGNCWLYAQASWLESMLKTTTGEDVNVSETYLTYWDMYEKLMRNEAIPTEELNTGGSWKGAKALINKYGWVKEDEFIPEEKDMVMSKSQSCAEKYILKQGRDGGPLFGRDRTDELVRRELDKAFSCDGAIKVDMDKVRSKAISTRETRLVDIKTGTEKSLADWLDDWQEPSVYAGNSYGQYEGKKLPSDSELTNYRKLEQRIKKALNDHQPVVLSWYVSFNAANDDGLFNLSSLAATGEMGSSGGHMVVLHDYTVKNVPNVGALGEGDLSDEDKNLALQGDIDYLVVKNSWGADRPDRPWLRNGYSRLSWDYLLSRYENDSGRYSAFIRGIVFPPGY